MKQYGKIIAQLRKENNMTQAELGAKLNVTYQAVSKWENDQSQPDFATMAQIAEIFHVPLTVFLGEEGEAAVPPAQDASASVVGYCTVCGNTVHAADVAQQRPLICKTCAEEEKRKQEEAARKAEEEKQAAIAKQQAAECGKKLSNLTTRNRGLIWGAVIAAVVLVLCIVGAVLSEEEAGIAAAVCIIFTIFTYTFASQMFWGGFVFDTCLFGGKIIGTPGIIFSFDLDGFIFLIVMKVLFAILRLLVFVLTFIFFAVCAYVLSIFTFFPALVHVTKYGFGCGE